ncbi:hypothetical protein [Polyangium sp. 6x1]|uniref:hypothetical protein n=1 Tax=Polyangium sp. 6x1 TaxID=3042689 RepID=UPI0024831038|nr:hypothetical protein [Polyangium sp. 6x1]MDI1443516.1 hypothetical protein [Polyangium sp. 6x1]
MHTVKRLEGPDAPIPTRWLGGGDDEGPVYVFARENEILWSVGIDFGEASHVPFRAELVWESVGVVVLGGGDIVYILDIRTGDVRATLAVPSHFGHLALAPVPAPGGGEEEFLFLLGWTDVHAVDRRLELRWAARDVAVDGIVFREIRGDALIVSAEMDPPGGWVEVALDIRTGAELSRGSESPDKTPAARA